MGSRLIAPRDYNGQQQVNNGGRMEKSIIFGAF